MTLFDKPFSALLRALAVLSAGLIAAITLVIPLNVVLRNLGLPVIYGALDAIEYALMVATFLAAPWVLHINAHVQVDLITRALPPAARRGALLMTCLIGAATCSVMGWYAFEALVQSQGRGSMVRTAFTFPEWWTFIPLPASMLLCTLEFLRKIARPVQDDAPLTGL
jgi:TRAP-type C4-dicarboxylate transport system permease small subunit